MSGDTRGSRKRNGSASAFGHEAARFTYLEYLEFTSAEEFRKFRDMPPVSRADIDAVDMDELLRKLLGD